MSDNPKQEPWVLRLALGMIFCATLFYVCLEPHDWRGRGRDLDHSITDWEFFYPFVGALVGLAIEAASHLIGGNYWKRSYFRFIAWSAVVFIGVVGQASDRGTPRPGSRDAAGLPMPRPFLGIGHDAREDFERRLIAQHTVPIVAVLGVVVFVLSAVLIIRLAIRHCRSCRTGEPELPQWMIR
jgi:hypothetical protein